MLSKRLKILFISREYPPETGGGGIGSYLVNIAPALAKRGHEVHILSYVPNQKVQDHSDHGVYVHRRGEIYLRGLSRIEKVVRLQGTIKRIYTGISIFLEYRRLGIDFNVIEYPDWGAEGWVFSIIHGKPLVAHLHTPLAIINRYVRRNTNLDTRCVSFLERLSVKKADYITSPSLLLIKELTNIGWLRTENVDVIPYSIDMAPWKHVKPVVSSPPNILFIGRVEFRKAPEILLEAIYSVRRKYPEAKGIFVGKSNGQRDGMEYLEWIRNSFPDVDNIAEFPGEVSLTELPKYLSNSRLVVMPSWFDNYPLAVLEAMACGRPVVVTETCGVAGLIERRGCGRVVSPGDATLLGKAMEPFLADIEYAAMVGAKARETVQEELNPERISEQREIIYRKAISLFEQKFRLLCGEFQNAIPAKIGGLEIPSTWRKWAIEEVFGNPWKHFYLCTAEHLLRLLIQHPFFKNRRTLEDVMIMDFGCTPAVSILLACLGADVVLLDKDEKELKKAMDYASVIGVKNRVKYVVGDIFNPPIKERSFDVIWNSGVIEHFANPYQIIKIMSFLVTDGGALITIVPNLWTPHSLWIRERQRKRPGGYYWDFIGRECSFSKSELKGLFGSCGLKVIASSQRNLRRTIFDDSIILPIFGKNLPKRFIFKLMNLIDWIERRIRIFNLFGFMTGVAAMVLHSNNIDSNS